MAGHETAKDELSALLKSLPPNHPLRALTATTSKAAPSSNGSTGKRSRASASELEEARTAILAQLKSAKAGLKRSEFKMEGFKEQTFIGELLKLVMAEKVKQDGTKGGAKYLLG